MFPIDKYKFIIYKDPKTNSMNTIAISTYTGKIVKGIAKCSPNDTYNEDIGKKLAAARCNYKICQLRAKNAKNKMDESKEVYEKAKNHLEKMKSYNKDSKNKLKEAKNHIKDLTF